MLQGHVQQGTHHIRVVHQRVLEYITYTLHHAFDELLVVTFALLRYRREESCVEQLRYTIIMLKEIPLQFSKQTKKIN